MDYTKNFMEALEKQNGFNLVVDENWTQRKFPQHRAMWTEAAEMAESFEWEWWKNVFVEPDYENIQVEIIDIFHFFMSHYIQVYKNYEDIAIYFNSRISYLKQYEKDFLAFKQTNPSMEKQKEVILSVVDEFVSKTAADRNKPVSIILFYKLMAYNELSLSVLFKKYFGKCVLNKFRQDNNYKVAKYSIKTYKEDGYLKEWEANTEDNVFMLQFIENMDVLNVEVFMDELYMKLDDKYQDVISNIKE